MAWTDPKNWVAGDPLTAAILNTHLKENLNALKAPPEGVYNANEGTDLNLTSTSWADVDATAGKFSHTLDTKGGRVLVTAMIGANVPSVIIYFRILIDGVDQTPNAADGIARSTGGSIGQSIPLIWWSSVLSADTHTVKLQYKLSAAGTVTIYRGAGAAGVDMLSQFAVREVS